MEPYHDLLHWIAHLIGHRLGDQTPAWLHAALHVVLIWMPAGLIVLAGLRAAAFLRHLLARRRIRARTNRSDRESGLPDHVFAFVLRHSWRDQLALVGAGLLAMPVLYATLELPKIIVNGAIDSGHFPVAFLGQSVSQAHYLFALCGLYLFAILTGGSLKFWINVYKGRVGERLLRRLRLSVFRRWHAGAGPDRRSEIIPLVAQEVEPIGGFACDAFALPVFQGGTFVTILAFMFLQDPVLGAAAITLLPLQLAVIPRLQKKVNRLSRERVQEIRALGGCLGDLSTAQGRSRTGVRSIGGALRRIETIRREIHRSKYFMKSLNNFLTALTPFFFYSIGGYLVIQEELSIGALIAVLAAYKDFSAPLRELFRYYQSVEDVRIRYREIDRFLSQRGAHGAAAAAASLQRDQSQTTTRSSGWLTPATRTAGRRRFSPSGT